MKLRNSDDKNLCGFSFKIYLNDFDNRGVKVWLQVEPGLADIETLIDLVLTQYGHHSSIVGFRETLIEYQKALLKLNAFLLITACNKKLRIFFGTM